jgi:hypothetical protein
MPAAAEPAAPAALEVAATPAPAAAPAKEIFVSQMPAAKEPAAPAKKGSARDGVLSELRKRAKPEPGTAAEPAAAVPAKAAEGLEDGDLAAEPEPHDPAAAAPAADKKRVNPWKLVDEYKAKSKEYEAKIAEVEKRAIPESKMKEYQAQIEAGQARLKELEEEIRYVNFSKSEEFKSKYQQPYDAAWKRAMGELKELTIEEDGGQTRPVAPADILSLVNKSLPEARKEAVEKFGDFADDVMAHRKEIRRLFDEQESALTEARTSGEKRESEMREKLQKERGEATTAIKDQWAKANEAAHADEKYGTYFKPVEGDEQGNQRLAKGFELADRAFSENPMAPGLTPEQRSSIVQRHAAVRNRAAAFGRLVHFIQQRDTTIAELKAELAKYDSAEPPADTPPPGGSVEATPKGMSGVLAELRKRAK